MTPPVLLLLSGCVPHWNFSRMAAKLAYGGCGTSHLVSHNSHVDCNDGSSMWQLVGGFWQSYAIAQRAYILDASEVCERSQCAGLC